MLRLIPYLSCLLGLLGSGPATGQKITPFEPGSDRLQQAMMLERRGIAKHDSLLLAEAWYRYGKTYFIAGDHRTAQAYFMKALRVHEPRGDSPELSRLYIRLSENEAQFGRLDESLRLANLSLSIAQRIRYDVGLIRAYQALGDLYERMWANELTSDPKKYGRVLLYYKKQEYLCYKTKDSMGIAETSIKLGCLFTKTKNPLAIPYLRKAVYLFNADRKDNNKVDAMLHLVSAYLMARDTKRAFETLSAANQIYERRHLNDFNLRLGLEDRYVRCFQATRQWQRALDHLEKRSALEKSQLLANNNGAISRLNLEYKTEKKDAALALQQKELVLRAQRLHTQQRVTGAVMALLVVAAAVSFVFFRLYRKNQRISRQNAELVKEQNHRVKNNLQIISSLLSLQSKGLSDEVTKKAIDASRLRIESMAILHRRLYDGAQLARVDAGEFIRELVVSVLNTYGYYSIRPEFRIDTISISADQAVPLGLILNELTTNACKYAFPGQPTPHYLITGKRHNQHIQFTVTDNGPGLEGPGLEGTGLDKATGSNVLDSDMQRAADVITAKKASFGMQLIRAQVEQLNGTCQFHTGGSKVATGVVFTMAFNE